jgi:hypothetical protein
MTATWVDLPGLFPLDRNGSLAPSPALRVGGRDGALLQQHQADLLLLSLVLLFLVGSYLVCRCCRCRWRELAKTHGTRSHAYTLYQSNASGIDSRSGRGAIVMESVTSRGINPPRASTKKSAMAKAVLVSEMEEPFLGPSDYAQPPPYEMSPPAYDYLPSAPPLSDDASHSPRQV